MKLKTFMKSCLIAMVFLLFCFESYSQAMLGYSPAEVREKFPDAKWEYEKWGDSNDLLVMSFKSDDETYAVAYYFDENSRSVFTTIIPLQQGVLQGIIERYNKRYVIIDDRNWKFYSPDGILKCSLKQTDKKAFYFLWSE